MKELCPSCSERTLSKESEQRIDNEDGSIFLVYYCQNCKQKTGWMIDNEEQIKIPIIIPDKLLKDLEYSKKHPWDNSCQKCGNQNLDCEVININTNSKIPIWICKDCGHQFVVKNGIPKPIKDEFQDIIKDFKIN